MRLFIFDTDGTLRRPDAKLRTAQAWQVGDAEGFEEDTQAHIIATDTRLFGRLPNLFPSRSYQAMVCAATEFYPLRLDLGVKSHYRADRPDKKAQAERLQEINKVNQAESNRSSSAKPKEGLKERMFTWVSIGLVVMLLMQGLPLLIPAFKKAMEQ